MIIINEFSCPVRLRILFLLGIWEIFETVLPYSLSVCRAKRTSDHSSDCRISALIPRRCWTGLSFPDIFECNVGRRRKVQSANSDLALNNQIHMAQRWIQCQHSCLPSILIKFWTNFATLLYHKIYSALETGYSLSMYFHSP